MGFAFTDDWRGNGGIRLLHAQCGGNLVQGWLAGLEDGFEVKV